MSRNNHLETYVSTQSINFDLIVACIDTFFSVVDLPTFIVVDRASIHTSAAIFEHLEEWKERGLTIFELPAYSPELNLRMQPRGGFLRMCCTKQLRFCGDLLNMSGLK
jgi:DDE superfamily endonuclease